MQAKKGYAQQPIQQPIQQETNEAHLLRQDIAQKSIAPVFAQDTLQQNQVGLQKDSYNLTAEDRLSPEYFSKKVGQSSSQIKAIEHWQQTFAYATNIQRAKQGQVDKFNNQTSPQQMQSSRYQNQRVLSQEHKRTSQDSSIQGREFNSSQIGYRSPEPIANSQNTHAPWHNMSTQVSQVPQALQAHKASQAPQAPQVTQVPSIGQSVAYRGQAQVNHYSSCLSSSSVAGTVATAGATALVQETNSQIAQVNTAYTKTPSSRNTNNFLNNSANAMSNSLPNNRLNKEQNTVQNSVLNRESIAKSNIVNYAREQKDHGARYNSRHGSEYSSRQGTKEGVFTKNSSKGLMQNNSLEQNAPMPMQVQMRQEIARIPLAQGNATQNFALRGASQESSTQQFQSLEQNANQAHFTNFNEYKLRENSNTSVVPNTTASNSATSSSIKFNEVASINNNNEEVAEQDILSVSSFVAFTNNIFNKGQVFAVTGEISEVSIRNHMYFRIKDENSCLDCIMFANVLRSLPFKPELGHKVVIYGRNSIYPKNGQLRFMAKKMELSGIGQILLELNRLMHRLQQEGVFALSKRPLPSIIERVGIVTSLEGRVRHDIEQTVQRRNPTLALTFFDTKVQGPDAPLFLVKSLNFAYAYAKRYHLDVLIVGRGGGSLEDLLGFSDERVVRLVSRSPVPIISAVGHDPDRPLCDYSADVRASTPTAAAEMVTPITLDSQIQRMQTTKERLHNYILRILDDASSHFLHLYRRLGQCSVEQKLFMYKQRLQQLEERFHYALMQKVNRADRSIHYLENRLLNQGVQARLSSYQSRVSECVYQLAHVPERLQAKQDFIVNFEQRANQALVLRQNLLEQKLTNLLVTLKEKSLHTKIVLHQQQLELSIIPRLEQAIQKHLAKAKQRLDHYAYGLDFNLQQPYQNKLEPHFLEQKLLHNAKERLNKALVSLGIVEQKLEGANVTLNKLESALARKYELNIKEDLSNLQLRFHTLVTKLEALNPLYQLERGLSLTTKDGLHSINKAELKEGDELITILAQAKVYSTVTKVEDLELEVFVKQAQALNPREVIDSITDTRSKVETEDTEDKAEAIAEVVPKIEAEDKSESLLKEGQENALEKTHDDILKVLDHSTKQGEVELSNLDEQLANLRLSFSLDDSNIQANSLQNKTNTSSTEVDDVTLLEAELNIINVATVKEDSNKNITPLETEATLLKDEQKLKDIATQVKLDTKSGEISQTSVTAHKSTSMRAKSKDKSKRKNKKR